MVVLPKSLAIIGGGVIGMEFASFFNSMGVKVSVIEMMPEIFRGYGQGNQCDVTYRVSEARD